MPDDAKKIAKAIATELKHKFEAKTPKFTPKWSREWVIPDNDLLPNDAKAEMLVNALYPQNRPRAEITILEEWSNDTVPEVRLPELKLQNRKVVKNDGTRPSHKFTLENAIWGKYDKLLYHFECKIDKAKKKTTKALKVKRWHVHAIDKNPAEAGKQLPFRHQEEANHNAAFQGRPDDAHHTWVFVRPNTTKALFAAHMRNTYSLTYTGHGQVVCGTCGQPYASSVGDGSDAQFGRWTVCRKDSSHSNPVSTFCIGNQEAGFGDTTKDHIPVSFFHAEHVRDENVVESTPKYLVFSVACGGAFETSLYDAYIGRGTKYGVGFKKSTRCDWARDYAKSFFNTWVKTHKCDPSKIPDVFKGLQATWETKLQPDIFGKFWGVGSHLRNLGRRIAALF